MKGICVIGSLNTDLVATVESFPKPGESVFGQNFQTFTGGKGAMGNCQAGGRKLNTR